MNYFKYLSYFLLGVIVAITALYLTNSFERHLRPYTIIYESYTQKELAECIIDPYCNDIMIFSDLPQRKDGEL